MTEPTPREDLAQSAKRAAVWTLVVLGIVVLAVVVWKLRLVVALLFLAIVIAAAMRPAIEGLARRRIPTGVGLALHYFAIVGLFALFIWLVVPHALTQVENALGVSGLPTSAGDLNHAANIVHRGQARHPHRATAPPRASAVRVEARAAGTPGRSNRLRDSGRDLLRVR